MSDDTPCHSMLPAIMAEIAEVAGVDAAWALARAHGGTTIYIPREPFEGHWLVELVGEEAAAKICKHFRVANTGARVLIPIARQGEQRMRLVKALEAGMSAPQAASVAGMHERSAFRARKKLKKQGRGDNRQGKLF
jgi:hypothetical protein